MVVPMKKLKDYAMLRWKGIEELLIALVEKWLLERRQQMDINYAKSNLLNK